MLFKIGKILVAIFVVWLLFLSRGFNLFYYFFPPECVTISPKDDANELIKKTLKNSPMCIPMPDLD